MMLRKKLNLTQLSVLRSQPTRSTNVDAVRFAVRFAQNAQEMGIYKATRLRCVLKRTAPTLVERSRLH